MSEDAGPGSVGQRAWCGPEWTSSDPCLTLEEGMHETCALSVEVCCAEGLTEGPAVAGRLGSVCSPDRDAGGEEHTLGHLAVTSCCSPGGAVLQWMRPLPGGGAAGVPRSPDIYLATA